MEAAIGSLERRGGDVITVATGRARQTPLYDPISHLFYVDPRDDVRTTIVNGKVLMKDGRCARSIATPSSARPSAAQKVRAAVGAHVTTPIYGRFDTVPVIEAVAHDESLLDLETDVLDFDVDLAPRRLAEEAGGAERFGPRARRMSWR